MAVGRGVKDYAGFDLMVRLAEAIHAQVAATRGAIDEGWISHERGIGLSGQRVRPQLYIACGISGSNFHTVGIEHSEYIIAVNVDRHARIFELADFCVVEDVTRCIGEILRRLEYCKNSTITPSADQVISLFRAHGSNQE